MPLRFIFHPVKAVQVAAHFLRSADIDIVVLMKMVYMADREMLLTFGRPITGDVGWALPFGPVPSETYNMAKGESPHSGLWSASFERLGVSIHLLDGRDPGRDDLCDDEVDACNMVVRRFTSPLTKTLMTTRAALEKVHMACKEWQDVRLTGNKPKPIEFERIFKREKRMDLLATAEEFAKASAYLQEL